MKNSQFLSRLITYKTVVKVICICFAIYGILFNSIFAMSGMKKGGLFLGFTLCLIFLVYPTKYRGKQLIYYDFLLASLGFLVGLYTYLTTERFSMGNLIMTPMDMIMGVLAFVLVILATKRAVGYPLAILPLLFSIYALYGNHIPGIFGHSGYTFQRYFMRLYMVDEGIYGLTMQVAASYVFLFIIFGALLAQSGVAAYFMDWSNRIAGTLPGGPAKVSVISSGLMGTISGSSVANVATTGAFTIPMMIKVGYSPAFAGAVESIASTGGMIMPPIMGSAAFLMIAYLGVPYSRIMLAAVIPAFLYYFSIYMWVHFEAKRIGSLGMDKSEFPPIRDFQRRILLITPVIVIVIAMVIGYTAIYAAFIGMIFTILVGLVQKERMTFRMILDSLETGAKTSLTAMMACITAGIIVGACNMTGVGQVLTYNIITLSGNNLLIALILTAASCLVLSMGLPASACYILVVTISAPSLIRMGVVPIAAHMFVFIFSCYSNVTPPVAIASYTAAGLAGANPIEVALKGLKIAAPGFIIPFLFVYNPILLFENVLVFPIIEAIVTATIGVLFMAIAGVGFRSRPLPKVFRFVYIGASLLLIIPEPITDIVGALIIMATLLMEYFTYRKKINLAS